MKLVVQPTVKVLYFFVNSLREQRIWIDRIALPPRPVRAETCNCEMQMRSDFRRVAGAAHVAEQLPAPHGLVFCEPRCVVVKMRVVMRKSLRRVELIDR